MTGVIWLLVIPPLAAIAGMWAALRGRLHLHRNCRGYYHGPWFAWPSYLGGIVLAAAGFVGMVVGLVLALKT